MYIPLILEGSLFKEREGREGVGESEVVEAGERGLEREGERGVVEGEEGGDDLILNFGVCCPGLLFSFLILDLGGEELRRGLK